MEMNPSKCDYCTHFHTCKFREHLQSHLKDIKDYSIEDLNINEDVKDMKNFIELKIELRCKFYSKKEINLYNLLFDKNYSDHINSTSIN